MVHQAEQMREEGQTVMFVAADNRIAGLMAVSDPIKETTPSCSVLLLQRRL